MNKKLLTVAVSAALMGAMGIAHADVKINGTINASLDDIKGNPHTTPAATSNKNKLNVSSNASNVVLSADEDLGGGLHGVFTWQEFVLLDHNSGYNQSTSGLQGGNTYVGLKSDMWGMVALGTNDSAAKQNGRAFDLFGNQIGDSRNADIANNRLTNQVFYVSPNFAGLSVMLGHSTNTNEATTAPYAVSPDTAATTDASTTANNLMVKYANGPLAVGLGYDKLSPKSGNGDKWLNVGAKYGLPTGTDIVAVYQKHNDAGSVATGVSGTDVKTWGVGVAQKFGMETIKAQYYQGKISGNGLDCKPKLLAVGWDHSFSKSYTGYVAYAQAKQDGTNTACQASMAGGGHGDNPGTVAGQTMSGVSIGAIMKF